MGQSIKMFCSVDEKKRKTLEGKNGEIPKMVTLPREITSILLRKINI